MSQPKLLKKEMFLPYAELFHEILYSCISEQVQLPKHMEKYLVVYPTPSEGETDGGFLYFRLYYHVMMSL